MPIKIHAGFTGLRNVFISGSVSLRHEAGQPQLSLDVIRLEPVHIGNNNIYRIAGLGALPPSVSHAAMQQCRDPLTQSAQRIRHNAPH